MIDKEYSYEKLEKVNAFRRMENLYKRRKYEDAKKRLEEFLVTYPDDELGWHYYSKFLMHDGKYEEALAVLNTNSSFKNTMMEIDRVKCFIELGEYEEAYFLANKLLPQVNKEFSHIFLRKAIAYSTGKLRLVDKLPIKDLTYDEKQFLKYDRSLAINHIKKTDYYNPLFSSDIDIEALFEEVEPLLKDFKRLPNTGTLNDTYLFLYPNIGVNNGKSLDILKVAAIHNTDDIVKMYPIIKYKKYPQAAINDIGIDQQKVKKLNLHEKK